VAIQEEAQRLPTTSYAILGLFTFGEMSGYDVLKGVEGSVGFFWSPAKSQVYAELRRLQSLGYLSVREVEQQVRPDKRVYRITPKGGAALREWLETSEPEPDVVKIGFLVKVFFGGHMSREALLAQLKEYRRGAEEELDTFRDIERQIKDSDENFYPYLTLKAGLTHARASIRWADEVTKLVEERREV
jgi:DNA-binding PadR family transcriptional regulator